MGMRDIADKPAVLRITVADGEIVLRADTVRRIQSKDTEKGDVLTVAEIAAIQAVKRTPELIAHCHQVPIDRVEVEFSFRKESITAKVTVTAVAKTGVEMESLVGVSAALLSIWDMVKYLEKDAYGQYPVARIRSIRILKKTKGEGT